MRACAIASTTGAGALLALGVLSALGACGETPRPEVPGPTTARPSSSAAVESSGEPADAGAAGSAQHAKVDLLEASTKLEPPVCSRLLLAAVRGSIKAGGQALASGDVLVVLHPEPLDVDVAPAADAGAQGRGLAVAIVETFDCAASPRPAQQKTLVSGKDAPPLVWANGTMRAHLDVGSKLSPNLYLGRLEGTAAVAEHEHETSSETLIAIEASGTFTLDGKESRLGPRQIVHVPKGTKHAWRPDPGSKLVALQIYEPPGPEQRFVTLAAAAKDAGAGAAADAGKRAIP